jgi:hypothetical protein
MRFIPAAFLIAALSGCKKQSTGEVAQPTGVPASKPAKTVKAGKPVSPKKVSVSTNQAVAIRSTGPVVAVGHAEDDFKTLRAIGFEAIPAIGFEFPEPDVVLIETLRGLLLNAEVSQVSFEDTLAGLKLQITDMKSLIESFNSWQRMEIAFEEEFWPMLESDWGVGFQRFLIQWRQDLKSALTGLDSRILAALDDVAPIRLGFIERLFEFLAARENGEVEEGLEAVLNQAIDNVEKRLVSSRETEREYRFVVAIIKQVDGIPAYLRSKSDRLDVSAQCMSFYWNFVNERKFEASQRALSLRKDEVANTVKEALKYETLDRVRQHEACHSVIDPRKMEAAADMTETCFDSTLRGDGACITLPVSPAVLSNNRFGTQEFKVRAESALMTVLLPVIDQSVENADPRHERTKRIAKLRRQAFSSKKVETKVKSEV